MKSIIPCIGGKTYQANWIISHFPDHYCFNDVFIGGGSITLSKSPSKVEIVNDIDGDLINFLKILKSQPERLFEAVDSLPVSRSMYDEFRWSFLPDEPFEKAVRWWYIARQSYGGRQNYKSGWRHSKTQNYAAMYHNACQFIKETSKRFRRIQIECLSYEEEIEIYDSPTTLHYCDPPYRGREYYYPGNFTDDDHKRLAQILHSCKGKVVLSYYEDELIDDLYKDFYKVTKDFPKMSGNQEGGGELAVAGKFSF